MSITALPLPATPGILSRVWRAVVLATLGLLLAVIAATVVVPRLAGATPYTILTGSMASSYPPGTLVVVEPVDASEIAIGDVVTYQRDSGRPEVVTHRVIGVGSAMDGSGERVLRTQGDMNPAPDVDPVREVQLRGRVWYSVPHAGRVGLLLSADQRRTAVVLVAAGLLGYAGLAIASSVVERHRARRGDRP